MPTLPRDPYPVPHKFQFAPGSVAESLAGEVERAQTAAAIALQVWLDTVAAHIRELAEAADVALQLAAATALEVPGDFGDCDNHGEGGEELDLVAVEAMDAHRFAQEAAYWLAAYHAAEARMEAGNPGLSWDTESDQESMRRRIEDNREAMRQALFL